MKRQRQEQIARIIGAKPIATQGELARELERRGFATTQSSISRDIVQMGLVKLNGAYRLPGPLMIHEGPDVEFDTAGDNIIIAKTEIGQAQPVALTIDRIGIREIVGTVAGDDTILIAVRDAAAQRAALGKLWNAFKPASRSLKKQAGSRIAGGGRAAAR
jgi:transcriptional regulator of arginine metabolism